MKKILCLILLLILFCCSGCGKQEEPILQEEPALKGDSMPQEEFSLQIGDSDKVNMYQRLTMLIDRSTYSTYSDGLPDYRISLTREEIPGVCWIFEIDDEIAVEIYGADISIKVELIEELRAKYTIYKNNEEVDSFEAFLYASPPDMFALYVDINKDETRDVVIIGSKNGGGFESTPWTYAYDVKNREQIHVFDVKDGMSDGCLTEKQMEQVKTILNEEEKLQKLLSESQISIDDSGVLGGIPMVDVCGNVYFDLPIWGTRYHSDVYGRALLILTYNADTKEFDVCDIVYFAKLPTSLQSSQGMVY